MRTSGNHRSLAACPALDVLRAYASGQLASDTVESVAGHISTCASCSELLSNLTPEDDSLNNALRACVAGVDAAEVHALAGTGAWHPTLTDDLATAVTQGPGDTFKPEPLPARLPLTAIGHYQVTELIDRGGMGAVYKAFDTRLKQVVAIKTLRHDFRATPEARERFLTEGKAAARLAHPNIVRVLYSGEYDGEPYLVMEHVPGGSLAGKLSQGPLLPEEAAGLVERLARAIQYAHERGVNHRDLKPANVLLAADGTPKIGDFGLARLLDEDARLTQTLAVMGTPAYMAPEQAAGDTTRLGPATDVYGLGAILYEALTGRPPFEGTKDEVLRKVKKEDVVPLSRWRPTIPAGLEAVCLRCLEKRPRERFSSAGELADELARCRQGEEPKERPRGWMGRRLRAARRHPVRTSFVGTLVLCAAAALPVADRLDPDREIKRIERELAAGRKVELIGATGGPRWSRWVVQGDTNPAPSPAGEVFSIQAWNFGLVELIRDPQSESFSFTVDVKHLDSQEDGEVGVYLMRRQYPTTPAPMQQVLKFSFNDITLPFRPGNEVPKGNQIHLTPYLFVPGDDHPVWQAEVRGPAPVLRRPDGRNRTGWHTLIVSVSPAQVQAFWAESENQIMTITMDEIASNTAHAMQVELRHRPGNPFAPFVQPIFPLRGGLGLYVSRGSAAFRSVMMVPRTGV